MNASEININEKDYYLSNIEEYCAQVEQSSDESDNMECLFCILRDMGYLLMYGSKPGEKTVTQIRNFFVEKINFNASSLSPLFIDFTSLDIEIYWYTKLWKNHNDFIKESPTLKEGPLIEEAWEQVFNEMKQKGLNLITEGFDIVAVLYAYQELFKNSPCNNEQNNFWQTFAKKANGFFNAVSQIDEKYFFHISELVRKMICNYIKIPDIELSSAQKFIKLVLGISQPQKSYAADSAYRMVISPEKAEEIYFNISCNYKEDSAKLSKIYLYECALAEETIKHFIMKKCIAEKSSNNSELPSISDWKLFSSSDYDDDFSSLSMIKAGNKEYAICIIPPGMKGFSLRSDLIEKNDKTIDGVLFCSFKQYPSDEILVRFDNYIEKERVFKLFLKDEGVQNIKKLSFEAVYKYNKRNEFLQTAAMAVMGLEQQLEWLHEFVKQFFKGTRSVLDNIVTTVKNNIPLPEFTDAPAQAATAMDEENRVNYYIPFEIDNLESVTFLDFDSDSKYSNQSVADVVSKGVINKYFYTYLFVADNKFIDDFHDPEKMSSRGITFDKIPEGSKSVWFFVGESDIVENVQKEYKNINFIELLKSQQLYWIVYGPKQ